jgi:hypothetical protein
MIDEVKGQRKLKGKRTCAGDVARRNEKTDTRNNRKMDSSTKQMGERKPTSSRFSEEGAKEGANE